MSCFQGTLASEESLCSQLHQAAYPSVVKAIGTCLCLRIVYGGSHLVHILSMSCEKPEMISSEHS